MLKLSRRRLLAASGSLAAVGLLAACGGQSAAPTTAPTTAATSAPAAAPTAAATAAPTSAAAAASTPAATTAASAATSPTAAAAGATTPTAAAGTAGASTPTAAPVAASGANALQMTQFNLKGAKLTAWAWQSFTPAADRWIADQAAAWGKQNGGSVEYDIVQNSVFNQKLAAAIESKTVPDLIMLSDVLHNQSLGILIDLTDEYNKLDKMAGGFYKSLLPGIQTDNKVWGIPIETGPSPLFTRLDIMQQVTGKREPPASLDDMENVAKQANKPPSFYGIGWTLGRTPDGVGNATDLMRNDGGFLVNKEGTKPTVQSDGTIAAMTRLKRWWDEKLIPPDSTSWDDTGNNSAYQSKRAAFVDNPASIYGWLVANDQQLLGNTAMAPLPKGKVGAFASGAGGWCWTVAQQSQTKDGAIALVDFLMQPNNLELECEKIGGRWYPTYQDLGKSAFWTSKPQFNYYPELITNAVYDSYPAPPTPNLESALGEASDSLIIADMVQAIIVNGTSIDQAVSDAQAKYEAIFKKYKLG